MTMCESERQDKKLWHGVLRARERVALANALDWEAFLPPLVHDVSDRWAMGKDGRQWLDLHRKPRLHRDMRK